MNEREALSAKHEGATTVALKLALEALGHFEKAGLATLKTIDAITAIKESLANVAINDTSNKRVDEMQKQRHEQEPVAHWSDCAVHSEPAYPKGECDCGGFNTPPQRTWVGLTDDEIIDVIHPLVMADMADEATDYEIARAIEAKLKEKNT